ncbi:hypothetical protein BV898_15783, partial [Hypsibius exemplaris]
IRQQPTYVSSLIFVFGGFFEHFRKDPAAERADSYEIQTVLFRLTNRLDVFQFVPPFRFVRSKIVKRIRMTFVVKRPIACQDILARRIMP